MMDALTATEEQVTNAQPIAAHPDKIREQMSDNNVSVVSDLLVSVNLHIHRTTFFYKFPTL